VYGTGDQEIVQSDDDDVENRISSNDISNISMSNLVTGDPKMILSAVAAWLFTGLLGYFLRNEWIVYVQLRQKFLSQPSPAQYTIMLRDIPIDLRSDGQLLYHFRELFGNKVFRATVNADLSSLDALVDEREATCAALERYLLKQQNACKHPDDPSPTEPQLRLGGLLGTGICGEKEDAIPYLQKHLSELNEEIRDKVQKWGAIKSTNQTDPLWPDMEVIGQENSSDDALRSPLLESKNERSTNGVLYGTARKIKNVRKFTAAAGYQAVNLVSNVVVGSLTFGTTGFVTFNSLQARTIARQVQLRDKAFTMFIDDAPYPDDIDWSRIGMPFWERSARKTVTSLFNFLLILLYLPFFVFTAALGSVENLEQQFSWLEDFLSNNDALRAIISGVLPQLGVIILIVTLPPIFKLLARWEGTGAFSMQYLRSFDLFYSFLLFQILLVVSVSTSLLSTIETILNNPQDILNLLAGSNGGGLPGASSYYISYTIISALVYVPLELLQLSAWVCYPFTKCCCAPSKTARDLARLKATGTFMYDSATARWMVIFVIGLTYSVIAPLLLPFCALYFGVAYITYAYVLLRVYERDYQAGGILWPMVFSRICWGAVISQLTLLGLIIIKQQFVAAPMLLPLPAVTIFFRNFCMDNYYPISKALTMETALKVDKMKMESQKGEDVEDEAAPFLKHDQYLQPSLLPETMIPLVADPNIWNDPRDRESNYSDLHRSNCKRVDSRSSVSISVTGANLPTSTSIPQSRDSIN